MRGVMMENKKVFLSKEIMLTILLVVIALLSIFVVSKKVTSPSFNAKAVASLDEKKVTVLGLAATAAASSTALSAIPGDTAMPIADQIAELSKYFIFILGAIMLEKVLLAVVGHVSFTFIIPAACALFIGFLFFRKEFMLKFAIKLSIFGIVIFLAIPSSIYISNVIEDSQQAAIDQAVAEAKENQSAIEEATVPTPEPTKPPVHEDDRTFFQKIGDEVTGVTEDIGDKVADVTSKIGTGVSDLVKKGEESLGRFLDTIAILIITSCVIPIVVILIFIWIIKILFGFDIRVSTKKSYFLGDGPAQQPRLPDDEGEV